MLKIERQKEILRYLDKKYTFSVSEMAKYLNVSDMTIRRDVNELADQNKLIRLYGGAQKLDIREKELTTEEKINLHIENKEFIGKVMNSIINDDDVVYVGAGIRALIRKYCGLFNVVFVYNFIIF